MGTKSFFRLSRKASRRGDAMMQRRRTQNGISNDSDEFGPKLEMLDGYPIKYSCEELFDSTETALTALNVTFDYEVTIPKDHEHTVEENLRELEWSVLWNVAQLIGLKTPCELELQDMQRSRGLQRDRGRHLDSSETYVASLDSRPGDKLDASNDVCVSTNVDSNNEFCVAVNGVMTAMHTGSDAELVESYLKGRIQSAVNSDTIIVKDISQVVYQGNRTLVLQNLPAIESTSSATLGSSTLIAVSAAGAAVAFVLIALFVRRYVKRSSEKELDTMETAPMDLESNPTLEEHTFSKQPRGMVSSDVPPAPKMQHKQPTPTFQRSPKLARVDHAPAVAPVPVSKSSNVPEAESGPPPPGSFPVVDATTAPGPTTKSVSLASKRKRRKKKKKKRRRRNSLKPLKPLNEMETIMEAGEEDLQDSDDDSSEYASDYSSDDNRSLSRSSSTDSLTRLDPSPPLLPAPEFKENSANVSSIPRLPPPWV